MDNFIDVIAKYVIKYASQYDIKVHSPIIAQAILESGKGSSLLAKRYHNYFGMKCGSVWKGKSVNLKTKEEYTKGTYTTIRDNFRVYDSIEEGIKGYFDFINTKRYSKVKGVTDPEEYITIIKNAGYATSSIYVESIMRVIKYYDLTRFDYSKKKSVDELAREVLSGKWGNGLARKNRLTEAGYDYNKVQNRVNKLVKKFFS